LTQRDHRCARPADPRVTAEPFDLRGSERLTRAGHDLTEQWLARDVATSAQLVLAA
jgi:hypothetical protein